MKVLMVGNNKGGVGKTMIAKTFSEYAALVQGRRVLMIDLDPQTNLSQRFLEMEVLPDGSNDFSPPLHPSFDYEAEKAAAEEQGTEIWSGYSDSADIWLAPFAEPYPTTVSDRLWILPAHAAKLQRIELVDEDRVFDRVVRHLRDFLFETGLEEDYDLVVIDLRPSKGPLVQAAMYASTHLLIPTELESPSVEGLQGMLSAQHNANHHRPPSSPLTIAGIVPNKVKERTSIHREFLDLLRDDPDIGPHLIQQSIPDWTCFREAMLPGAASIFSASPNDRCRVALEGVYSGIYRKIMEA